MQEFPLDHGRLKGRLPDTTTRTCFDLGLDGTALGTLLRARCFDVAHSIGCVIEDIPFRRNPGHFRAFGA